MFGTHGGWTERKQVGVHSKPSCGTTHPLQEPGRPTRGPPPAPLQRPRQRMFPSGWGLTQPLPSEPDTSHQPPNCQHKSFHNEKLPGKPHKTFTVNSINWISNMVAGLGKPGATPRPSTPLCQLPSPHTAATQTGTQPRPQRQRQSSALESAPHAPPTPPASPGQLEPCRQNLQKVLSHSRRVKNKPRHPPAHLGAAGTQFFDICQSLSPAFSMSHTVGPIKEHI